MLLVALRFARLSVATDLCLKACAFSHNHPTLAASCYGRCITLHVHVVERDQMSAAG